MNSAWRFYDILGRTQGKPDRLSVTEEDDLDLLGEAAVKREDFHMAARIGCSWAERETGDAAAIGAPGVAMMTWMRRICWLCSAQCCPRCRRPAGANLRQRVQEVGREKAIAELAGQLEASVGLDLPMTLLRELCAAMVAQAMDGGGRSRQGRARLGLPY